MTSATKLTGQTAEKPPATKANSSAVPVTPRSTSKNDSESGIDNEQRGGNPFPTTPETGHTDRMHRTTAELDSLLDGILAAPQDAGPIEMIVRRPSENQREVIDSGELTSAEGLVGDDWKNRFDEGAEPYREAQLTLMNARVADAVAVTRDRWPLAGDQIYVDMDISKENLPAGTRLRIGDAVVEISETPHTGCAKFSGRFGKEALRWANVGEGRDRRFRGVYAFVVEDGGFAVGDKVTKI